MPWSFRRWRATSVARFSFRGASALGGWRLVVMGSVVAAIPHVAHAQFPRIAPPPPCRVPPGVVAPAFVRPTGDRRPLILVEPFEASETQRDLQHIPWSLATRLRERLQRDPRFIVPPEGSVQRAVLATGGRVDSVARLWRADLVVRGTSVTTPLVGTTITIELRRPLGGTVVWSQRFTSPSQPLAVIEAGALRGVVAAALDSSAPPYPRGRPTPGAVKPEADRLLSLATFLLRVRSLALADSARRVLERAQTIDSVSLDVAERLGEAYVTVLERGGITPPVSRDAAIRRIDALGAFLQARDARRASGYRLRAAAARLADPADLRLALQLATKATSVEPQDADAAHDLAVVLALGGETERAAAQYRRALALEPDRANSLAALGAQLLESGAYREACAYLNASIGADPYEAIPYGDRARVRMQLAQARDAYADAETAARLTPDAWTQSLALLIMASAGDLDGARPRGREMVRRYLQPGGTLSVRDAEYLAMGLLAVGDTRYAMEAMRRARPLGPPLSAALRRNGLRPLRGTAAYDSLLAMAAGRRPASSPGSGGSAR